MKFLVIDDHALIRQAMHGVLKKLKRDAVVIEAASWDAANKIILDNPDINLIILDLTLPDKDGFAALAALREAHPAISVVVVSALQDSAHVTKAFDMGALGYIPKSAEGEVMLNALRLVLSGGIYVPPSILVRDEAVAGADTAPAGARRKNVSGVPLTDRQLEVLNLMMEGKSNKTISRTLNLAEPTVKNHVTAILKLLKVSNRTEAVIAMNDMGWKRAAAGGKE